TTSVFEGLMTWVAPSSRARSSLESTTSTAIITDAGDIELAIMLHSPTAPAPKTATDIPGNGCRTFITVPAPVWTPQPRGQRISRGRNLSTLTAELPLTIDFCAKLDWPKKCEEISWSPR